MNKYVYTYVYIYICIHTLMYSKKHCVCIYVFTYVYTKIDTHKHAHLHLCLQLPYSSSYSHVHLHHCTYAHIMTRTLKNGFLPSKQHPSMAKPRTTCCSRSRTFSSSRAPRATSTSIVAAAPWLSLSLGGPLKGSFEGSWGSFWVDMRLRVDIRSCFHELGVPFIGML